MVVGTRKDAARRALASATFGLLVAVAVGRVDGQSGADFNGDGFDDMAIGVHLEDIVAPNAEGVVHVIYGSASGLDAAGSQLWSEDSPGIADDPAPGDGFGRSVTFGDFNADGFDDLVIGVPSQDIGAISGAGAVHVLYGTASGLASTGSQMFTQATPGIGEVAEPQDSFGSSSTSGDFDGDGYDDLAIGVTNENVGMVSNAGLVCVLYGAAGGLDTSRRQNWTQESPGVPGTAAAAEYFGVVMVAGDFNGDGRDELVVATSEDVAGAGFAGTVTVLVGTSTGLSSAGSSLWSQDSAGVHDAPDTNDQFGSALAAGDFDGDGAEDLAVGVFQESIGALGRAGAVHVFYGGPSGITSVGSQFWTQDAAGVPDASEAQDLFGRSLVAANYIGDGKAELLIGVPGEDGNVGVVQALRGSASGLVPSKLQRARVLGGANPGDLFANVLASGDFDGDGRTDLVASVPTDDVGPTQDGGSLTELSRVYGARFWTQDTDGIEDMVELDDHFGIDLLNR